MFCHKKSSLADLIWSPVWFVMAVIGTMTVVGVLLTRCGKLKGNCRRLAEQCGQAVGNAAGAVADAIDPNASGSASSGSRSGSKKQKKPSFDDDENDN
ncbi:MAG: hypothetical protein SOZ43_05555 [Eubacteriales bacterium]|nr:hypothetical protein [Eubacteriales bacterium]